MIFFPGFRALIGIYVITDDQTHIIMIIFISEKGAGKKAAKKTAKKAVKKAAKKK